MEETIMKESAIATSFAQWEASLNESNATIKQHRRSALEAFENLGGIPGRQEAWKYSNPALAFGKDVQINLNDTLPAAPAYKELDLTDTSKLVFIDGLFAPALSNVLTEATDVYVGSLADALKANDAKALEHFNKYALNSTEAMTALNTAFTKDGAYIYVPKGKVLAHTVEIVHLFTTEQAENLTNVRNLIVAEANTQLSVVEQHYYVTGSALVNELTEVFVGENSTVDIYQLQNAATQQKYINSVQAHASRSSRFNVWNVNYGGSFVRNNVTVDLNGPGAEAHLNGAFYLENDDLVDNHLLINHNEPDCYSNQLYKGLLDSKSTGVFNGKVYVKQDAQRTNAFQSNKNILLSDEATMNTKPELEIYADDVKCSHGATLGQIDEAMLFYLRARGLDKKQAAGILNQAFIAEVIDTMKLDELKQILYRQLAAKFNMEEL